MYIHVFKDNIYTYDISAFPFPPFYYKNHNKIKILMNFMHLQYCSSIEIMHIHNFRRLAYLKPPEHGLVINMGKNLNYPEKSK